MALFNKKQSEIETGDNQREVREARLDEIARDLNAKSGEKATRLAKIDEAMAEVESRMKAAEAQIEDPTDAKSYAKARRDKQDAEAEAEYYHDLREKVQGLDVIGHEELWEIWQEVNRLSDPLRDLWPEMAAPIMKKFATDLLKAWADYSAMYECFIPAVSVVQRARPDKWRVGGGLVEQYVTGPRPIRGPRVYNDALDIAKSINERLAE